MIASVKDRGPSLRSEGQSTRRGEVVGEELEGSEMAVDYEARSLDSDGEKT